MAFIQDITPAGKKPTHHSPQKVANIQARRLHQATIIPPLTMESVKQLYRPSRQPATAVGHPLTLPNTLLPPITKIEQHSKTRVKIFNFLKYPLLAIVVLAAGGSSTVGQVIICIYFVVALIFKMSSRISFVSALVLLICIPLFGMIGQGGISDNAAIYAFELLVIGTVQSIIEIWKDRK